MVFVPILLKANDECYLLELAAAERREARTRTRDHVEEVARFELAKSGLPAKMSSQVGRTNCNSSSSALSRWCQPLRCRHPQILLVNVTLFH